MSDVIDQSVWTWDPITRTIGVGATDCSCTTDRGGDFAGRTYAFSWIACGKCKGTGKRGSGKCRACAFYRPGDYGHNKPQWPGYFIGAVPDYENPYDAGPCTSCDGTVKVAGDGNAYMPADILAAFLKLTRVEVMATTARVGHVEGLLGVGGFDNDTMQARNYTVLGDYGRRWDTLVAAKANNTLPHAVEVLRRETVEWVAQHRASVCNWAVDRAGPREAETWAMPTRIVAMVSPNGVRYMAVRDKH